ncbi:hypothetical protein CCY99_06470 [Helicobacter sp. 16-1353]|uniref:rhodanese-like domain-containing protein n=1 Tax=Helicobacter sp. 16-1353 TaxID=2004996 RepID=UPI000DCD4B89|nr:rhodanese-like domain-containing protein [Helicobacter sp. 16-1353]RAX53009.1 hypothetical protein CCY99_06470 [Helicobacter sp. 16-1353]
MGKIIYIFILLFSFAYADLEVRSNVVDEFAISTKSALNVLNNNGILIDIRTPMEWESTGVIEGSKLITFYNNDGKSLLWSFIKELSNNNIKKGTPITLICNSGFRTKKAIQELQSQGFNNITYVKGGILQWKKDKLPLESYQTEPYQE